MLETIDDVTYTKTMSPFFMSSIGAHMRHILDHFTAIENGMETNLVDYDKRRRDSVYETNIDEAIRKTKEVKLWLKSLAAAQIERDINIKTEINFLERESIIVKSSVSRELAFVLSHTVHHFSMIDIALKMQGVSMEENFGLAPATISYLKKKNNRCVQ